MLDLSGMIDSKMWILLLVLSLVGVVTKLVYYNVGKRGKNAALEHIPRLSAERWDTIQHNYQRRGSIMLLLSSIPLVGSVITATAGAFETHVAIFVALVFVSNLIRNWFLIFVFNQTLSLLPQSA